LNDDISRPIFISFLLFFIGFLLGVSLSTHYKIHENDINIAPFLGKEFSEEKLSFSYIFTNNFKAALILSFGGTLTFGGLAFLNLVLNGMNLGALFYEALSLNDLNVFLLLTIPHGIFEFVGLIIAGSAGFKIPYELLRFALGKKKEMITEEDTKEFFKLVGVSIALILIAAIIESKITLKLAACIR